MPLSVNNDPNSMPASSIAVSDAPASQSMAANTAFQQTSSSPFGVTTNGIRLTVCTLTGTSWPDDLILDLGKSNWLEWSRKLTLLALQQGFDLWLDGTLPCPDLSTAPEANFIWKCNDGALRSFIQTHVSGPNVHLIKTLPTAHLMFEKLKSQHEQQGAFAQINLLLKELQIEFSYERPIRDTLSELRTYY